MRCAFYRNIWAFIYAAVAFAACFCAVSCTDAYSGKNMPEGDYSEAVLLKVLEEDSTDTATRFPSCGGYTRGKAGSMI